MHVGGWVRGFTGAWRGRSSGWPHASDQGEEGGTRPRAWPPLHAPLEGPPAAGCRARGLASRGRQPPSPTPDPPPPRKKRRGLRPGPRSQSPAQRIPRLPGWHGRAAVMGGGGGDPGGEVGLARAGRLACAAAAPPPAPPRHLLTHPRLPAASSPTPSRLRPLTRPAGSTSPQARARGKAGSSSEWCTYKLAGPRSSASSYTHTCPGGGHEVRRRVGGRGAHSAAVVPGPLVLPLARCPGRSLAQTPRLPCVRAQ